MSAVMLILSAAPSLTAAAAEKKTAWVKGDANGDGAVSISDVTCIQNYLADLPVGIVLDAADVTGDGEIAVTDVTNIQYFLAGLPSSLDSKLSNDELYELSVRDAVFADEDEIMPPVNISKDDDRVIWDGDKVLVTITHKYPDSYPAGEEVELKWGDAWCVSAGEMYSRVKESEGVTDWTERFHQVLGVPTSKNYNTVTGNTVTYQTVYVKEQSDTSLPHAEQKTVGGKTYYVFPCSVAAKEMTSNITAQIIDGVDQGDSYTYSVKEYADYLLEHADDKGTDEQKEYAKAFPLVEKMLQYGAYAKEYFDETDTLNDFENVSIDINDPVIGVFPEGTSFKGATLSLKSETTLSLYFTSNTTLTFSCADYNVEIIFFV